MDDKDDVDTSAAVVRVYRSDWLVLQRRRLAESQAQGRTVATAELLHEAMGPMRETDKQARGPQS